jgi:hypothetical protein
MLDALKFERKELVARGLTDRVRQVDEAIRALSPEAATPAKPAAKKRK